MLNLETEPLFGENYSMKTYKVALTRRYLVSIEAENEERAKELSEFFVGDCPDLSNEKDRERENFFITDIEMFYNNADDVDEIVTCFELTKYSFDQLKDENIPDNILESLRYIENQKFSCERRFLNAIEKQLGKEQTVQYKNLILKYTQKFQMNKEDME